MELNLSKVNLSGSSGKVYMEANIISRILDNLKYQKDNLKMHKQYQIIRNFESFIGQEKNVFPIQTLDVVNFHRK